MAIKYTIREVATDFITVDYDSGNWAKIQVQAGQSRSVIEDRIRQYANTVQPFAAISEVPFQSGETGEVLTYQEMAEENRIKEQSRKQSYAELRKQFYPSIGDQLDAAYWARQGQTADQERVDAAIERIKQALPKGIETLTLREAIVRVNGAGRQPVGAMTVEELITHLEA